MVIMALGLQIIAAWLQVVGAASTDPAMCNNAMLIQASNGSVLQD